MSRDESNNRNTCRGLQYMMGEEKMVAKDCCE